MAWNQGSNPPPYNPSAQMQQGYGYAAPAGNVGYGYGAGPQQQGQYGAYGPPPPAQYAAPGVGYGAPAGPPVPQGVDPTLWAWFVAVDQDRSGQITVKELQQALTNNNWSHFNEETCRLMIGMFDRDRSGTINIYEFQSLWKYIQEWKSCFDRFDTDRSGNIDQRELHNALRTFGYNLSEGFCQIIVRTFDRRSQRTINFDDFIQCCVMIKSLTDKFRQLDTNMSGVVTMHYEQFLEMVIDNTIV